MFRTTRGEGERVAQPLLRPLAPRTALPCAPTAAAQATKERRPALGDFSAFHVLPRLSLGFFFAPFQQPLTALLSSRTPSSPLQWTPVTAPSSSAASAVCRTPSSPRVSTFGERAAEAHKENTCLAPLPPLPLFFSGLCSPRPLCALPLPACAAAGGFRHTAWRGRAAGARAVRRAALPALPVLSLLSPPFLFLSASLFLSAIQGQHRTCLVALRVPVCYHASRCRLLALPAASAHDWPWPLACTRRLPTAFLPQPPWPRPCAAPSPGLA